MTVWFMLGAVDWNTLLVQQNGFYEPGVFDVRCNGRRPTALAALTSALAAQGDFDHPVLDRPGWWRRDGRHYRAPRSTAIARVVGSPRRLAITGANGTLGKALSRICHLRGLDHELLTRGDMDIADQRSVEAALERRRPWAVINAAGYVRVADASREAERCYRENAIGAETLARACARLDIPFVTFSSDLVFDGQLGRAYVESDAVGPACVYGNSKADAERRVLQACPDALIVRTSAFFGPWDEYNFVLKVLRDLAAGRKVEASDALLVSPTYVPDLAHAVLDLLIDRESGVWHLANQGLVSWHELATRVADAAGVDTMTLIKLEEHAQRVTGLSSERGLILPSLDSAIERYVRECTVAWQDDRDSRLAVG
jgi:dTDP-4-dehydrorhamnose reductase